AGTFASLALFLSVTAHIAARNVLGDVPVRNAFVVGPVPAAVAVAFTALDWPSAVAIAVALAADGLLIDRLYRTEPKLSLYVTFIHVVVSIILGVVVVAGYILLQSAPG
ncbi:MAG: hypothetical protein ABEH47_09260, partial [Haloferacaceae archaeon]